MKSFPNSVASLGLVAVSWSAATASAHVCLDLPTSRAAEMCQTHDFFEAGLNFDQKVGPCGSSNGRSATPAIYKPGETITVKWTETIDHDPSWYRISFNPNGASFEDPTSYEDSTGKHPHTLKDGIMDVSSAAQETQVTLPNITCENCTLQLIQVMGDKGGNGFGGNDGEGGKTDNDDLYYACADIILRGETAGGDAGAPDAGTDSSTPDGGPTSADSGSSSTAGGVAGGTAGGGSTGTAGGGSTGTAGGGGTTSGVGIAGGGATTGGGVGVGTAGGGATTGSAAGAGAAGGVASGTTAGTLPPGEDGPTDDGCDCAVSDGSAHYGNLLGMSVLGLALLAQRRRFQR